MADRTVNVRLLADIDGYLQNMEKAKNKAKETASAIEQHASRNAETYRRIGTGLLTVGTLAAAGIGLAIAKYAEFDAAMSNVQAATGESIANMALLRQAALDAGAQTAFSATEAAAAIEELSKAGLTTSQILGGALTGALDLAAASGIAVADAAETIATTLNQFNLEGEDSVHVADLLAAAAGKAQGGVEEMSGALSQSALVASQMGLSIEETTGSLAAFASAGLMGSDAGTSFRSMLLRMANPTGEAADLMKDLGLAFYDANGEFVGMESVAGQLEQALAPLPQVQRDAAMATLFGADAIRAANILYSEGEAGIRDWTAAVDDQGYAAEQAEARLDNLKGDVEALMGSIETLMITVGAGADGPLRSLVQGLTDLINGFNELDPATQNVIIGIGLTATAATLLAGGILTVLPRIAAARVALTDLGIAAQVSKVSLAGVGIALGGIAVVGGLVALAGWLETTKPSAEDFAQAIRDGADAIDILNIANEGFLNSVDGFEFDTSGVQNYLDQLDRIEDSNGWAAFLPENWDVQFSDFNARIRQIDEALAELDPEEAQEAFDGLVEEFGLTSEGARDLLEEMPNLAETLSETGGAAGEAEDGIAGVGDASENAAAQAQELLDVQSEITETFFAAQNATMAFEEALDEVDQAFADAAAQGESLSATWDSTTNSFDLGSESGRYAATTLQDLVTAANNNIEAMAANGATADEMRAAQQRARDEIARVAGQFDSTGGAASTYTGLLNAIPENVLTDVEVQTAAAEAEIAWFTRTRSMLVQVSTSLEETGRAGVGSQALLGLNTRRAGGGIIPGPPSDRDNIIAALATGEFVINARQTARYLPLLEAINAGTLPGYANGGLAMSPTYNPTPIFNFTAPASTAGGGVTVGQITFQADGSRINPQVDQVMHSLRTYTRGGRR